MANLRRRTTINQIGVDGGYKEEENISMWSPTNLSPLLLIIVGRLKLQLKKKEERLGRRGQKALALQPIAQLTLQIFNETKKTFTAAAADDKMFSRSHRGEKCFCTNLPLRRLFIVFIRSTHNCTAGGSDGRLEWPAGPKKRDVHVSEIDRARRHISLISSCSTYCWDTCPHHQQRRLSMNEGATKQNNRLIAYSLKELGDKETIDRLQSEINPYHDLPR